MARGAGWRAATSAYLALVTLASAVVVDGGVAAVVGAALLLRVPARRLVALRSFVLRWWMRVFIGHFEHFSGLRLVLTGDALRRGEAAIVVCNHRTWMDTVILYSLARQVGGDGDVKFIGKKSLLGVPVYGVAGAILDVVYFITRRGDRARNTLDTTYARLSDPGRGGWPFWLISYLEGTRRTRDKLAEAQAFAKRRDLPPLQHVLQPRTKGFVAAATALRGQVAAVYDITLGYQEDDTPERDVSPDFISALLLPGSQGAVHVHQRRIPLEKVPEDEDGVKKWIYKLYAEKDELLVGFHRTGQFDGRSVPWDRMPQEMLAKSHAMFWTAFVFTSWIFWKASHILLQSAA